MNVYEAIAARRTIRDFDTRPIEQSMLQRILGAGVQAPSHDHLRNWRFILVEDMKTRKELAAFFCKEWTAKELERWLDDAGMENDCQRKMYRDGVPKQGSMVLDAGSLVIPCFRQTDPLLAEKQSLHQLNAFASMWAVLENILIAGASEGVFGVTKIISSPEERDHIRSILHIPEQYEIPCYLSLGYPRKDAVWHQQVEISIQDSICINRWTGP